jgi:MscS family membrane protein
MLDEGDAIQEEARLSTYHYVAFLVIMSGGLLFVALLLYFTGDIAFQRAFFKAVKRLLKTVALRQLVTILSAIAFVKYGLEPAIKAVRRVTKAHGPWEKSPEYYILKEVR